MMRRYAMALSALLGIGICVTLGGTAQAQTSGDRATAFYQSGLAQQNQGHYAAAIAAYTQAITLNPQFAKAYKQRGYCEDYLQPPAYTRGDRGLFQSYRARPDVCGRLL